ncbi:MAG: glycerophosphodiester phosphodiesterase [Candidatus Thorarchaeota archaeon]
MAHRGASSIAPENSLKAFQKAIDLKADYIEFDVRQTKDGEIVIIHDRHTSRTTGQSGKVKNFNLSELKKLDCGEGESIPTLQELVDLAKGKINLNCEIKVRGIAEKVVKILNDSDFIDKTIISSFKHDILIKIHKLESQIKLASLEPTRIKWVKGWLSRKSLLNVAIKNHFYAVKPFYRLVNQNLIVKTHKNNIKIIPWTVDSESEIKRLINLGIDGIITNEIQKVKNVLNEMN